MNYVELARLASVEIVIVMTTLVVLGVDLGWLHGRDTARRRGAAIGIGATGCVVAVGWLVGVAPDGAMPGGMLVSDALTRWVKVAVLLLTLGTLLLSARAEFTTHPGEYVSLLLLGAVGMLLVAGTENALVMFMALELASLTLYVLTGFDRRDPRGAEAAFKYFLFGGMAGAILLFGLSFAYGATGAIEFRLIANGLGSGAGAGAGMPLALAGLVMVLVGLGFKLAAAPFHFWAPDAYEAAPTPVAGFIASGSKIAAFFITAKLVVVAFGQAAGGASWSAWSAGWAPVVAWIAAASMVWGNFAALAQQNVKRLLAYSAVAHTGYTLVALVAGGSDGIAAAMFHATTYAVAVLGAFGVVGLVERRTGGSDYSHFAGLAQKAPGLALCFGVFVLSLAGIPPLAGFFGKFYLFLAALSDGGGDLGLLWLVGIGAATTCVSFYYYLQVLKAVFVANPTEEAQSVAVEKGGVEFATVVIAAVGVVVAGCAPDLILAPLQGALVAVGL